MTLDEFYIKKEALQAPKGLNPFEEMAFYTGEIKKLQTELKDDDLKIVLERQSVWRKKMQSSVG